MREYWWFNCTQMVFAAIRLAVMMMGFGVMVAMGNIVLCLTSVVGA